MDGFYLSGPTFVLRLIVWTLWLMKDDSGLSIKEVIKKIIFKFFYHTTALTNGCFLFCILVIFASLLLI